MASATARAWRSLIPDGWNSGRTTLGNVTQNDGKQTVTISPAYIGSLPIDVQASRNRIDVVVSYVDEQMAQFVVTFYISSSPTIARPVQALLGMNARVMMEGRICQLTEPRKHLVLLALAQSIGYGNWEELPWRRGYGSH